MGWLGSGVRVRIPPPPKRAGFKRPAGYYHKRGAPAVNRRFAHLRLRGVPRTGDVRREMRRQAGLYRAPERWCLLLGALGLLFWGFFAYPFTRYSTMHFGALVLAAAVFPATFALDRSFRGLTAIMVAVGGGLALHAGYPVWAGGALLLTGVLLLLLSFTGVGTRQRR